MPFSGPQVSKRLHESIVECLSLLGDIIPIPKADVLAALAESGIHGTEQELWPAVQVVAAQSGFRVVDLDGCAREST
jgi:hypothetical protein